MITKEQLLKAKRILDRHREEGAVCIYCDPDPVTGQNIMICQKCIREWNELEEYQANIEKLKAEQEKTR